MELMQSLASLCQWCVVMRYEGPGTLSEEYKLASYWSLEGRIDMLQKKCKQLPIPVRV